MAISFVSHTRASVLTGSSLPLTKPSSGQDGDYALILAAKGDNANGFTTPSGWTLINQKISGLGDDKAIAAFYTKITTWSTWTAPTLQYTESEEAVAQLIIVRGADDTTFLAFDANSATYEIETNDVDSSTVYLTAPDTASIAIGDVTIIFGGSVSDGGADDVTQPTGYTGLGGSTISTGWDRAGTGNGDAQMVASYKEATAAGIENPGSWGGIGVNATARDWAALTFTIKAAAVASYDYQVEAFRVKKDTGGETSTDWLAALNTDPEVDPVSDTVLRPRWLLYNNGDAIPATADIRLRCQYNGGAAFTVNNTSSYVRSSNSSQISDWQQTTKQLTAETNFTAGYMRANGAAICLIDNKALAAGYWVENGFTIVLRSADLSDGDYVDLFLEYRLTDTDSYQAFDTVDHALRIDLATAGTAIVKVEGETEQAAESDLKFVVAAGTAIVKVEGESEQTSEADLKFVEEPPAIVKRPGTDSGGFQLEIVISDITSVWGSDEIIVQCSDIAGLNRSTDGGKTWFTVNRGFYDEDHYGAIGFLFSKYTKGTAYYIGVPNTEGGTMYLFKSTNFDAVNPDDITWTLIDSQAGAANKRAGLPYTRTHSRQMIEYDDDTNHYLLLASYDGLWLSVDDGNLTQRGMDNYRITSIVDDPNNIGTEAFFTTDQGTTPGVYRVHNPFTGTAAWYAIGTADPLDEGIELVAVDNGGTTELIVATNPRALLDHGEIMHGTSDPSTATVPGDVTWTNKTPSSGNIYAWSLYDSVDARFVGSSLHVIIGAAKESGSGETWYGLLAVTENFESATPTWKLTPDAEAELLDEVYGITPALASWWWDLRGSAWRPNKGVYDAMCVRFNPNEYTVAYAAGDNLVRTADYTAVAPVWQPAVNGMTCQLARSIHIDPSDDDTMLMMNTDFTQMSTIDGWLRTVSWDDDEVGNLYNDTGLAAYYHPDADGKVVTGREEGGVTWYTDIYPGWGEQIHWTGEVKQDAGNQVYGIVYFDDASSNEITIAYVGGSGFRRSVNKGAFSTINSMTTATQANKIAQGVYVGGGVGYFYIPTYGLVRFINYGASSGDYTRIWAKTGDSAFTGYLDYDQDGSLWVMANFQLWRVTDPDDGTMNADGTNATGSAVATQINSGTFTRIGAGAAHPTEAGQFGVINDAASGSDSEFWVTKDGGDNWTNEANGEFKRTGNNLTLMADCDSQGKFWFASKGNNVYPLQTTLGPLTPDILKIQAETEQAADSELRLLDLTRLVAETLNLADSEIVARVMVRLEDEGEQTSEAELALRALARIEADTTNLSEADLRTRGIIRQVTEGEQLGDSILRTLGLLRIYADTIQQSEGELQFMALARIEAEISSLSESDLRLLALVRLIAEAASINEGTISVRDLVRVLAETAQLTELDLKVVTQGALALLKIEAEGIETSEVDLAIRAIVRLFAETEQTSEEDIVARLVVRLNAASVNVSESVLSARALIRLFAESTSISEAEIAAQVLLRLYADGVQISESDISILAAELVKLISESSSISEADLTVKGIVRVDADGMSLSDDELRLMGLIRVEGEGEQVSEADLKLQALVRAVAEDSELTESVLSFQALLRFGDESINLTEADLSVRGLLRLVADTINLTDADLKVLGLVKVDGDTLQIIDSDLRVKGIVAITNEIIQAADADLRLMSLVRIADDSTSISEADLRTLDLTRIHSEIAQVVEESLTSRSLTRLLVDGIILDESSITALGIIRQINDSIEVVEIGLKYVRSISGFMMSRVVVRGRSDKSHQVKRRSRFKGRTDETQ